MRQKLEKIKEVLIKILNNKYFLPASIACVVFLVVILILIINPFSFVKNELQNGLNGLPPEGKTTIYGVEMKNTCFAKFQDFVKVYGADYSKCLTNFSFDENYCGGLNADAQGLSDVNVVVILDASGSMAGQIDSYVKMDVAKKAVSDFLTKMPQGIKTGLVVYGHKGSNSVADKSVSCKGIEEVVKLSSNNSSNILSAMESFQPRGWTPIAGSLDFAKSIFINSGKDNKNYLILVSDGAESCDGDPLASAENLKLAVPGVKLIIIGFAIDFNTRDFLRKVAARGDGTYLGAESSSDIATAFNDQLRVIKGDCIKTALFMASSLNNKNNLGDLDCWLASYKKEADDFTLNVLDKSTDKECNQEVSDALLRRHTESWYQKQELEEKNNSIYKKIEEDLNNQLKALGSPQGYGL